MLLAGHAGSETTRRFYLGVRDDLVDRARLATPHAQGDSAAKLLQVGFQGQKEKD